MITNGMGAVAINYERGVFEMRENKKDRIPSCLFPDHCLS